MPPSECRYDDSLGTFIVVDRQSLMASSRKIGRILVDIDIHCGLPEVLEIEWWGRRIHQRLDYLGIPFVVAFVTARDTFVGIVRVLWKKRSRKTHKISGIFRIAHQKWILLGLGLYTIFPELDSQSGAIGFTHW
jgi:hypothetical protein